MSVGSSVRLNQAYLDQGGDDDDDDADYSSGEMTDMQSEYLNAGKHMTNDSDADQFINDTLSSNFDGNDKNARFSIFLNPNDKIIGNRFRKV